MSVPGMVKVFTTVFLSDVQVCTVQAGSFRTYGGGGSSAASRGSGLLAGRKTGSGSRAARRGRAIVRTGCRSLNHRNEPNPRNSLTHPPGTAGHRVLRPRAEAGDQIRLLDARTITDIVKDGPGRARVPAERRSTPPRRSRRDRQQGLGPVQLLYRTASGSPTARKPENVRCHRSPHVFFVGAPAGAHRSLEA
jgi:hypothetical protein